MAFRLYIVPEIGTGTGRDPRRPKYFDGKRWAGMDYGFQPVFLVAADLTGPEHTTLVANADVIAFPADLTGNLTAGQVTTARDACEQIFIPGGWINTSLTWREVARTVAGMFQFMQRLNIVWGNNRLIDVTEHMDREFQSLSAGLRTALLASATSLGYSSAGLQPTTTVRAILKNLADQWGDQTFRLNEFSF